jgi:hypothetical protein
MRAGNGFLLTGSWGNLHQMVAVRLDKALLSSTLGFLKLCSRCPDLSENVPQQMTGSDITSFHTSAGVEGSIPFKRQSQSGNHQGFLSLTRAPHPRQWCSVDPQEVVGWDIIFTEQLLSTRHCTRFFFFRWFLLSTLTRKYLFPGYNEEGEAWGFWYLFSCKVG